jgi:penicillin-binding protein 1A
VAALANSMGISSTLDTYPPMAIGGIGEGVTPLDMASSYSTLANGGTHMEQYLVERVTREGESGEEVTVQEHQPSGTEVLSKDQAAAITQILRGVVQRGTAGRYRNLDAELGRPSAAKTGTTEMFVDAWYVGYVPQLTTSVWVGYPEERRSMVYVRGFPEINGENFPLDIWSLYMQEALKALPVQQFDPPSSDLKLGIKTDGRSYGKLDAKAAEKEKQEDATPPKPLYGEPQQPPVNPKPPPIYGREATTVAQLQQTQPASGQPQPPLVPPVPPTPGLPQQPPASGQPAAQ